MARYWQPRSAWNTTPGAGSRAATALVSASATSSVRRCSARANPTTRREAMSITVASYSQPSQVGMEVFDVAAPAGVDRSGVDAEVATHQVRAGGGRRIGDRGPPPPARSATAQARGAHQ